MIARLTTVACIVVAAVLTAVATASPTRSKHTTHFAGFPPAGVKASTPTTGTLVVGLRLENTVWNVYADGRIIWQKWTAAGDATVVPDGARTLDTGYVQQLLTPAGVQRLWSMLVATGLFEHDLRLDLGPGNGWVSLRVRRGDRMVTVDGVSSPDPSWSEHFTKATPAQMQALAWIAGLVAYPASALPADAWADRTIQAFVPAYYSIAFDLGYPDLSKLPRPAGKALARFKELRRSGGMVVKTARARALLQALVRAGISPSDNHAWNIGFSLGRLPGQPHPSYLQLWPSTPPDSGS